MIKPVSLNEKNDRDIIEHIEALNISFASYVRDLIRKDMNKTDAPEEKSEIGELVSLLKTMLNNNSLMMGQMPQMMSMMQMMGQMGQVPQSPVIPPPVEPEEEKEYTEVQKKAVNNIMNRFKK